MSAKSRFTVSPIAAAVSTAVVPASAAIAQEEGLDSAKIEEVIVTARKREQNLQEVAAKSSPVSASLNLFHSQDDL